MAAHPAIVGKSSVEEQTLAAFGTAHFKARAKGDGR
jgi:hypothetical protein